MLADAPAQLAGSVPDPVAGCGEHNSCRNVRRMIQEVRTAVITTCRHIGASATWLAQASATYIRGALK
jgi:hypothetical protein